MRHNVLPTMESTCSLTDTLDESDDSISLVLDMPDPVVVDIPDPAVMLEKSDVLEPEKAELVLPPATKKRKVSTQDIQKMQLEVLTLEKRKIELEMENMQLINKKLRLEIQDMLARSQPVSLIVENN
jgi:tRNA A58 N-methylase Trm61